MSSAPIDSKLVRDDQPSNLIAEIGINHTSHVEVPNRFIDVAVNAGCDAVKFQKRTVAVVCMLGELAKPCENPFGATNGDCASIQLPQSGSFQRLCNADATSRGSLLRLSPHNAGWFTQSAPYSVAPGQRSARYSFRRRGHGCKE